MIIHWDLANALEPPDPTHRCRAGIHVFVAATLARPDIGIIKCPITAAQAFGYSSWKQLPESLRGVTYFRYHLGRHVEVNFDGKHLHSSTSVAIYGKP